MEKTLEARRSSAALESSIVARAPSGVSSALLLTPAVFVDVEGRNGRARHVPSRVVEILDDGHFLDITPRKVLVLRTQLRTTAVNVTPFSGGRVPRFVFPPGADVVRCSYGLPVPVMREAGLSVVNM